MVSMCFYFQVHQPYRIRKYSIFDIGKKKDYFEDRSETELDNEWIINKIKKKCYLPTNAILLELLNKHPEFKITFSFSGVFLEQLEEFAPEVLESFQELVATGRVEILSETYYHSLSFLFDKDEFREQVRLHGKLVKQLFGVEPTVFRNTELIYNNELANEAEAMGYKGIIAEGADHLLGWRSPNFLYRPVGAKKIKTLLKNYKLSDDVAFRFSNRGWKEWPLDSKKYVQWINSINGNGEVVNLFMDYETFGEHQWKDSGIFEFLRYMPGEFLKHPDNDFKTPSEVIDSYEVCGEYDACEFVSWTDLERDLSAWMGNELQDAATKRVYVLGKKVKLTGSGLLVHQWRKLLTSNHFYYMGTKHFGNGNLNPYESPYEAFIAYMNVLQDLEMEVSDILKERGFLVNGEIVNNKINL
ncbi:glycoside hydrolase family 57 protein [archaeon]|nr:glycoside hydrolase family 57 protein [archaeon]